MPVGSGRGGTSGPMSAASAYRGQGTARPGLGLNKALLGTDPRASEEAKAYGIRKLLGAAPSSIPAQAASSGHAGGAMSGGSASGSAGSGGALTGLSPEAFKQRRELGEDVRAKLQQHIADFRAKHPQLTHALSRMHQGALGTRPNRPTPVRTGPEAPGPRRQRPGSATSRTRGY